ncbi:hypothetical protein ABB37_02951 [Leptomonas pyrrhocoris]|uniref:Leucine-rich repeat protein (LRRP) n=1 Tax=Leptomonas pyrrhocoris TaxID=157538 RepID=A0A0M9G6A3_LEPPY|nr:hypothetical protein ABB37_02951 [Leptomonas pyrrhocoris]KPA83283.1 hypothetical protein ABB37_02951 [Leptomonas pyrrhocoris]|eukprot:XP_015661722.1 hypothetical protein ABB37_02951 [Leptomonas pyrrhocoris]
MNEDSGGVGDNVVYRLSAQEEAALLAEYGTEGPFGDGVDWAAPSHFKSGLGDGDVFLTGATGAEEDAADSRLTKEKGALCEATAALKGRRHSRDRAAYTDPLTLYLLRHAPSLVLPSRSTPASLAQPISSLVSSFEDADDVRGKGGPSASAVGMGGNKLDSSSRFAPVLRSGKEWERRASLVVRGIPTTAFASYLLLPEDDDKDVQAPSSSAKSSHYPDTHGDAEADFSKLIGTTADMLRDADDVLEVLAAPVNQAQQEAEVQRRIEELQRREALVSEDFVDQFFEKEEVLNGDDDDMRSHELLQRAREGCQRLRVALASSADGTASNVLSTNSQSQEEGVVVQPLSFSLPVEAEYLYAFEMQLPSSVTRLGAADTCEADEKPPRSPVDAPLTAQEGELLPLQLPSSPPESAATAEPQLQQEQEEEASIPLLILRSSALLQDIAAAEQRDTQLLQQLVEAHERRQLDHHRTGEQQRGLGGQIAKRSNRDALGLVALPSFVERLDILISPTHDEQQERDRHTHNSGTTPDQMNGARTGLRDAQRTILHSGGKDEEQLQVGSNESKTDGVVAATAADSAAAPSLEDIRRQAAVESFLLLCESEEERRMRKEDELVEREARAAEEMQGLYTDQLAALQDDALRGRHVILTEEAAALKELSTARVKDAALARHVEQLRRLQQTEALVYTLVMEWEVHREQLLQDETLTFQRLTRDAEEARGQAVAATEKRESGEAAAARAYLTALRHAFEERRSALVEGPAGVKLGLISAQLRSTAWYRWRIEPLLQERAMLTQWAVGQRKQMESVSELLAEAETRYRRHITAAAPSTDVAHAAGHVVRVSETPPTKSFSIETEAGALTAEKLLQLLWSAFSAAVRQPPQAAQYLARWCLSLENIDSIEWQQLQLLELKGEGGAGVTVGAANLVKDMDLSGNPLRGMDLLQAVRTFPFLQRLTISHAQLQKLDFADPGQTSQQRGDVQYPAPRCVSASSATSDDGGVASAHSSPRLRHISAARHHALAEQVHLLEVDVSSNHLTSLDPLGVMATSSLTRCVAVDNELASLDSLAACTQLRGITVAHNKLTSVQCLQGLPLLRELDVGNNHLHQLDEDSTARASSGVTANPVPMWTKLFASHNHLQKFPFSFRAVCPFLSQLFINHNELTELEAEAMAALPLLRVLQAEGNKLTDIRGLQRCPRLESVKLSHNLLSTVSALLPLGSCRHLQVVDLSGNPLFPEGDSEAARQSTRLLCGMLPRLEELNNVPVRRQTEKQSHSHSMPVHGVAEAAVGAIRNAAQLVIEACTGHPYAVGNELNVGFLASPVPGPTESYREVFAALCWDAMMQHAQDERELQEALLSRELNRAKGWEATMTAAREAESAAAAVTALYGITAAQRDTRRAEHAREVALFKLDHATLSTWLTVAGRCAGESQTPSLTSGSTVFSNRHETHCTYRQREEDHLQRLARAYLAEWLLARVLVRRARRELHALQAAHRQSEVFRKEMAARRIQPVWRGAALRSRLHRLLHSRDAADVAFNAEDEQAFAKVNVNDWLTEDPSALVPVELLLHTVVDSAREVAAVPFDVPPSAVVLPMKANPTAPPSSFTSVIPNGEPSRARSGGSASGRPSLRLPPARPDTAEKPSKGACSLEEQWGPAVAAQIRKKQQKNSRAHNERMRKEFLQDPLRVQHEMRGDHSAPKPK